MQELTDRWEDEAIQRKLLVELYVFLAVCNKPATGKEASSGGGAKSLSPSEAEHLLVEEMRARRTEAIVLRCVAPLIKENEDTLWNIAESNSSGKLHRYVGAMRYMHSISPKKEFMMEAFKGVCNNQSAFFFSTKDYSPIIFQCMLKINYIYESHEMHDKRMDIYLSCLNCPMTLLNVDIGEQKKHRKQLIDMLSEENGESVTRCVNIMPPTIKKLRDIM